MPEPSSPRPGRTRRVVSSLVLLAAGLGLLVWTVRRLELAPADLRLAFSNIGVWFGAIVLLSLIRFGLRARAWITLTGLPLPLGPAVAATISGDALGNLTPLGVVASEPSKAMFLRRYADPGETLAALVAENFFYSVSVAVYVIVAGGAMFFFFDLPPAVRLLGQISFAGMAVVLAGAGWLAWKKPTLASSLFRRLPGRRLPALADRLRTFERQTYKAAGASSRPMSTVVFCEVSFHLLSLVECWLTFWLLSGETSIVPALVFDGFNRVINVVAKPMPLRLGVEEGGTSLLAAAIGLSASDGFMLGIVRKLRMILWAAIGMVMWAARTNTTRTTLPESQPPT